MSTPSRVSNASRVLRDAIHRRVFPAAVVEVGDRAAPIWREAFGSLTFDEDAAATSHDTVFDLASLTKPIATTLVLLDLMSRGRVDLDERVETIFPEWRGDDRTRVTVRDLLEHASGLPARLIDAPPGTRREFEHDICAAPLEYQPRTASVYSDLGFLLLGFGAADREGASLDQAFDKIVVERIVRNESAPLVMSFGVSSERRSNTAPTEPLDEDSRRGRRLVGEVHDNYAAALGGVAGHAGVFADVRAVGALARMLLRSDQSPEPFAAPLTRLATTRSSVPNSSRGLGWDTMLPTSSCGTRMSAAAFGHVGFTGTSLWIDPVRDRYFVLLTNRVCGGGSTDEMRDVRRSFHDALGVI